MSAAVAITSLPSSTPGRVRTRARHLAVAVSGVIALSSCGSSSTSSASSIDAARAAGVLQSAHWRAVPAAGMPSTYTHARQVAYLETVAPDGRAIDLQFLETPDLAAAELTAATQHGYAGTTIANVIVLPHTQGQDVPAGDVDSLRSLLTP